MFSRLLVAVLLIAALIVTAGAVQAQNPADNAELVFDIPAQSLETALEAFGERSRMQVLYETTLTTGRRSSAVKGMFTREAALQQLLAGTGLELSYTGERAFTLTPIRTTARSNLIVANYDRFLGTVQAAVLSALCQNPETKPGAFRLAMQFWVATSGRIENPHLLSSTGANRRDAIIIDVVQRLAFGQAPPSGMPQPITIVLRAGPEGSHGGCENTRP
ncbi:secretin and TonB N-terminal domain-containing protein [Bradyrhizobium cenepequi]|uniref:secretin and TonB N-terminal domain-containing protein n=1 Tax=Bradyrhizobium cenepequi TaxID=2821403 RepID=UPI001CE23D0E|nr:secretin and TonB N-terminal domain-containing protein [Bradyrhizobium cenepequi]MCA6111730.1 energy transducer TonB [Bradyrhizobium cenepequi]